MAGGRFSDDERERIWACLKKPSRQLRRPAGRPIDLELSIAFAGQLAAVRSSAEDGVYHVWLRRYRIAEVAFRPNPERPGVTRVVAHL